MNIILSSAYFATFVFDCDGVVLNSNKVKTEAFYQATLPYGEAAAQAMVDYHVANGGISRYKKFYDFLDLIAPVHSQCHGPGLKALLKAYSNYVRKGLLSCDIALGLNALRQKTPDVRWLIVSGGDQTELRDVFTQRGIAEWFDGGIFGSPETKEEILERELVFGNIQKPALYIGDSKYDYRVASAAGIDFLFLSGWTEVQDWKQWCQRNGIVNISSLASLL